jgi:plastocyanin
MTRLPALATGLLVVGLLGAAFGSAAPTTENKLHARVGPGFTINLTDDAGARVTKLDAGTYEIEVEDESSQHNFHLVGPGVDRATSVSGEGKETWTVTFTAGAYTYVCDPHASSMRGSFTVGGSAASPPTAGGGAGTAKTVTAKTKLVLTSGPGFTITLKTAAGKTVKTAKTGTYRLVVRDRSRMHNAHVIAPGFNRATTVRFVGTKTWKVRLAKPGKLRFLCDPHASSMKGSVRITR